MTHPLLSIASTSLYIWLFIRALRVGIFCLIRTWCTPSPQDEASSKLACISSSLSLHIYHYHHDNELQRETLYPSYVSIPFGETINKYSSNPEIQYAWFQIIIIRPLSLLTEYSTIINNKEFINTFDIYWVYILFKINTLYLDGRTILSHSISKYDWNWSHHVHEFWWS